MQRIAAFITVLFLLSSCLTQPPTAVPVNLKIPQPTDTAMPSTSTPQPTATPISSITLKRGINFGNMLEAPHEGDWGTHVQESYFDAVKQASFDFVRLPVSWSAHAELTAPYTIDSKFVARIDQIVGWAVKRNLTIILDFHNYDDLIKKPQENLDRFLGIWQQLAEHYKDAPANILFELFNEPNTALTPLLWNKYAAEALKIIRQTNPTRDVIIGPTQWNSYLAIFTLEIPKDDHLIVTFHYYEPFQFTHQGAEWVGNSNPWLGTTWDATDSQKSVITRNFDTVKEWSRQHGNVRVLLGEFGAYSKAPQDSRIRWTTFVREQAEAHGFAWSYWEFNAGFGAYDPNAKAWRTGLLKALIP